MDANYSKIKEALAKAQSAVSEAMNLCSGMSGEESSEPSGASPSSESTGYSGGGSDKIKAAVARIRMGK